MCGRYALRQPRPGVGDALRARADGAHPVLLFPSPEGDGAELAHVTLESALPTKQELIRQAVCACALDGSVPALYTAPGGARLVVDIRRFLLHVLPLRFVKIRHFGLLANRNRRQALTLCSVHLHATTPQISTLLTEPQKYALNRSCPQCKNGTLHVVARQLPDRTANCSAPLACAHFDSS